MKKTLKAVLSAALISSLAFALVACGGDSGQSQSEAAPEAASEQESTAEVSSEEASEPAADLEKIIVGASPAPHAQILAAAKEDLAKLGYDLEVKEFTDYVLPNKALDSGELDANFFQHKPYMDDFNTENGTKIVSVASIHTEPLGLYLGKAGTDAKDIDAAALAETIADGAEIAVPNDTTNEARALQLLQDLGLLKLKEDAGLKATVKDIVENPKNIKFIEIEAAQLPRTLPDVDFAVINGNYAIDAGIVDKLVTTESKESVGAQTFANILAVAEGQEESPKTKALIEALTSENIRGYIETEYAPLAIPAF